MDTHIPTLISLAAIARRLRVPARWLADEARAGRIPHLDAGGRLLADPAAVAMALARRARKAVRHGR